MNASWAPLTRPSIMLSAASWKPSIGPLTMFAPPAICAPHTEYDSWLKMTASSKPSSGATDNAERVRLRHVGAVVRGGADARHEVDAERRALEAIGHGIATAALRFRGRLLRDRGRRRRGSRRGWLRLGRRGAQRCEQIA